MEKNLVDIVKEAGVVGAGGAGFPTHVKVNAKAEYIVVNAAECEPLLRVDQQLIAAKGEAMLKGLKAVMQATGASKVKIALKEKYGGAVAFLQEKLKNELNIEMFIMGDFYPAGDEQVMVYETTGRIVPEGGIPLNVGVIVINVETLINIGNAMEGQPVTDKYVTVTGWVLKPVTVKVPLGVTFREVIQLAGGPLGDNFAVMHGGPVMGSIVEDLETPVTKTTKGLVLLPRNHSLITRKNKELNVILKQARSACCNCMQCTEVCPRYLLGHDLRPNQMMQAMSYGPYLGEEISKAFLCSECGVCDLYQCPMGLSPRRVNAMIKQELTKAGIKNKNTKAPEKVRAMREYRRVPSKRMLARLDLTAYDKPAPLSEELYQPTIVTLPLRQHIGAPAEPRVQVGSRVERGDLVATVPENALGANLHASISGTIKEVGSAIVIQA